MNYKMKYTKVEHDKAIQIRSILSEKKPIQRCNVKPISKKKTEEDEEVRRKDVSISQFPQSFQYFISETTMFYST